MKRSVMLAPCLAFFAACILIMGGCDDDEIKPVVEDIDGNEYRTVQIGSQSWFAENLRTTRCNDGTEITHMGSNVDWDRASSPAYCWPFNNDNHAETLGALYNGYVLDACEVCPAGWHVATEEDWDALIDYLGGRELAGAKLKEKGVEYWHSPNANALDEVGFSARGVGFRKAGDGGFATFKGSSGWWSESKRDHYASNYYILHDSDVLFFEPEWHKQNGTAIRCVKN